MMRSIGEVMRENYGDWSAKLEAVRRRQEQRAQDMRDAYGDDFDIEKCWHCGGRGVRPGNRGFCDKCETGLLLEGVDESERQWRLAIPSRLQKYRLASHPNRDVASQVVGWFQRGMSIGQNLYLGGPVGTGKTGMGVAALWAAHQTNRSILYTTVADMLHGLRPRDDVEECNPATMTELQTVDLLLLDDIGAEKSGHWPREQLYLVTNGRYTRGLPTIVTSNVTLEDLESEERVGGRPISRFTENLLAIWMDGEDLRQRRDN